MKINHIDLWEKNFAGEVVVVAAAVAEAVEVVEVVVVEVVVFLQYIYGTIKFTLETVGQQQVSKHRTTI